MDNIVALLGLLKRQQGVLERRPEVRDGDPGHLYPPAVIEATNAWEDLLNRGCPKTSASELGPDESERSERHDSRGDVER